jgi:hypothetical protein
VTILSYLKREDTKLVVIRPHTRQKIIQNMEKKKEKKKMIMMMMMKQEKENAVS